MRSTLRFCADRPGETERNLRSSVGIRLGSGWCAAFRHERCFLPPSVIAGRHLSRRQRLATTRPERHHRSLLNDSSSSSRTWDRSRVFMNDPGSQSLTPVLGPEPAFEAIPAETDLIGSLLEEQWDLSAVERFAQFHEDAAEPLQGRYYSALMPAEPPGPGQQYAFEVDLDRCSGCKACVAACNSLNGLDESETWREVGLLYGGSDDAPLLQHITTA